MKTIYHNYLIFFILFLGFVQAQDWTIEIYTGTSFKAPSSITIMQEGHPLTRIDSVNYETKPWVNSKSLAGLTENYYGVRLGYYPQDARPHTWGVGYELELLHDKAYYIAGSGNDPEGVIEHFELSDGLNQVLINVAGRYPLLPSEQHPTGQLHLLVRGGMGPVITAPATNFRGLESGTRTHKATDSYYWFAGLGAQASAQVRFFIIPQLALSSELKVTIADTSNLIAGGTAETVVIGTHINIGFTVQLP